MDKQRNWVPANDGRGKLKPYEDTGPAVYVDTSSAWANVAPATEEHTSARDRARALLIRAIPILILEFLLSLAIVILGIIVLGIDANFGRTLLVILLVWGGLGLGSYLWLAERSDYFSSTGVEHHRIDSATEIAITQIESDRDVRLSALKSYMHMLETKADATERKQIGGPL